MLSRVQPPPFPPPLHFGNLPWVLERNVGSTQDPTPGGVWRVACGVWRVACGVWRVVLGLPAFAGPTDRLSYITYHQLKLPLLISFQQVWHDSFAAELLARQGVQSAWVGPKRRHETEHSSSAG